MAKNDEHQFKLLLVFIKHFPTTIDPLILLFCQTHDQGQCSCFLSLTPANAPFSCRRSMPSSVQAI